MKNLGWAAALQGKQILSYALDPVGETILNQVTGSGPSRMARRQAAEDSAQ